MIAQVSSPNKRPNPVRPKAAGAVTMTAQLELRSEITCPQCRHRKVEEMPNDACQFFYECEGCGAVLRPKATGSRAAFHSGYPSSSRLAVKPHSRSFATASNASTQ